MTAQVRNDHPMAHLREQSIVVGLLRINPKE
jgi:hypothetical protein